MTSDHWQCSLRFYCLTLLVSACVIFARLHPSNSVLPVKSPVWRSQEVRPHLSKHVWPKRFGKKMTNCIAREKAEKATFCSHQHADSHECHWTTRRYSYTRRDAGVGGAEIVVGVAPRASNHRVIQWGRGRRCREGALWLAGSFPGPSRPTIDAPASLNRYIVYIQ